MAEFVQQHIEEMLPELEQIERIELMTPKETKKLLKKRKEFEYRLRRRTKQKEDFVNYAQYEMNVLNLLKRRRQNLGHNEKFEEIEVSIINRIHGIFRHACMRFQDDIKLWMSHIDFCKTMRQTTFTSKLYLKMLQSHSRNPGLWVAAAKFEVERCSSMENARPLLQRGLRFNPQSKMLWREYFRMELLFAERMRKRNEVLRGGALQQEEEKISDAVLDGAVAYVVFKQAASKFPDDAEFLLSFVPICQQFDFTQKLYDDIMELVRSEHGMSEHVWNADARQHLHAALDVRKDRDLSKKEISAKCVELEEKCYDTYEEAVKSLPTEQMYSFYLSTLLEKLEVKSEKHHQRRLNRTLNVFEKAADSACLSEDFALKWVEVLENCGQVDTLNKAVQRITDLHPMSARMWCTRLSYNIAIEAASQHVMNLFKEACAKVNPQDQLPIWKITHEWIMMFDKQNLPAFLESGLKSSNQDLAMAVKMWSLEWSALNEGIEGARETYKKLVAAQPLTLEFFQVYIGFMKAQPQMKIKRMRGVFEDAVRYYGSYSSDLWLEFIKLERTPDVGDVARVSQIHARALRTLEPSLVDDFIKQYTLLQTKSLDS